MAHNITERDGFFTVRQPAWHGLGDVLDDYPTIQEAKSIAHPWEPVTEPVYRAVPAIADDGTLTTSFEPITGHQAVVRSDDSSTLGIVSSTYEPVRNSELYEIAEALEGVSPGEVRLETGGSLLGGKKVWLLVRMSDPLTVDGDPHGAVIPYFALQNSHDGSGAFRGQATMTRIVCDNTSQMADMDAKARGTEFAFSHTKNVQDRIDQAKEALAGWRTSIEEYQRMQEHLLTLEIDKDTAEHFIEKFIPLPKMHTVSDRVVANVDAARTDLRNLLYGETNEGVSGTAYGLVAASVEYLNHSRATRSEESRFKRAYLDRSRLTADAVALALELA